MEQNYVKLSQALINCQLNHKEKSGWGDTTNQNNKKKIANSDCGPFLHFLSVFLLPLLNKGKKMSQKKPIKNAWVHQKKSDCNQSAVCSKGLHKYSIHNQDSTCQIFCQTLDLRFLKIHLLYVRKVCSLLVSVYVKSSKLSDPLPTDYCCILPSAALGKWCEICPFWRNWNQVSVKSSSKDMNCGLCLWFTESLNVDQCLCQCYILG